MPPKPFPFGFSVGVDICRIDRIRSVLGNENHLYVLRWGSKVFSRLEWPIFKTKFDVLNKHVCALLPCVKGIALISR